MKTLFTKKAIRNMNYKVLAIGYCELQNLLACENEFGYSAGVYGWSCNYYYTTDPNIIISTGYSTVGEHVDYAIIEKYENLAREVRKNYLPWEAEKAELQKLMAAFLKEVAK